MVSSPSFSANNPNLESNLNAPLNLNHAVGDGGLKAGTNSLPRPRMSNAPDAEEGGTRTPKKRESFVLGVRSIVLVAVGRCLLCGASGKVCPHTFLQGPGI